MAQLLSKKVLVPTTLLATALLSTPGMAVEESFKASATVRAPIEIAETTALDFDEISSTAEKSCKIEPLSGTKVGDTCLGTDHSRGAYNITSAAVDVDITVSIANPEKDGVTFAPLWYHGGSERTADETVTVTSGGSYTLNLGGTVTNGSTAPTGGSREWDFTISVAYK